GPGYPDHVVEQQLLSVAWGAARVLKARPVDHDPAQHSYCGVRSQRHGDLLAFPDLYGNLMITVQLGGLSANTTPVTSVAMRVPASPVSVASLSANDPLLARCAVHLASV